MARLLESILVDRDCFDWEEWDEWLIHELLELANLKAELTCCRKLNETKGEFLRIN